MLWCNLEVFHSVITVMMLLTFSQSPFFSVFQEMYTRFGMSHNLGVLPPLRLQIFLLGQSSLRIRIRFWPHNEYFPRRLKYGQGFIECDQAGVNLYASSVGCPNLTQIHTRTLIKQIGLYLRVE